MTEKKLRTEMLVHLCPDEPEGNHCPYCQRAFDLLADEPDVVKVLRWLKDKRDWELSEKLPHWLENSSLLDLIIGGLEHEFHVRLTETGWEWTDG